jgi:hypothetical protein
MRLSGLSAAAVLLLTSALCAQHTASAPSTPPPTPAPSVAVSTPAPPPPPPPPPSAPPPSVSSSAATSASASHVSSPSPSPVSAPVFHSSPSPSSTPAPSHVSVNSPSSSVSSTKALSPEQASDSAARRVDTDQTDKNRQSKVDSDLRRRECLNGACKEEPQAKSEPESNLRRRVCVNGTCPCGPGEPVGKNGCVAPAEQARAQQCQVGATWNGTSCEQSTADCGAVRGQAATLAAELRSIKAEMQAGCDNDPSGSECENAKVRMEEARQRYRMLINGASAQCRAGLPDEISLI